MSLNHPSKGENTHEIRRRAEFGIGEQVHWQQGCYIFVGQDYEMRVVDVGLDHDHPEGVAHVAGCYLRENLTYEVAAHDPEGNHLFKARLYGGEFQGSGIRPTGLRREGSNWRSSHAIHGLLAIRLINTLRHFGVRNIGRVTRQQVAEYIAKHTGDTALRVGSRIPQAFEWWPPPESFQAVCAHCDGDLDEEGGCSTAGCPGLTEL